VPQEIGSVNSFCGTRMKKNQTPKVGRPKLPKGEAKTEMLRFRLTPSELKIVAMAAKTKGEDVSEWARTAILGAASSTK
jgi:hypothetical protein